MKYAIIADIHANLEAFQVVLQDIEKMKCTHVACLGDVVGYGANPKQCLDTIRTMNIPCIKGNHDEYCSSDEALEGFNPHAAEAVIWTRKQLTEDDRKWLGALKYVRLISNFTVVHATLDGPQRWGYVFEKLAAAASFTYQNTSVCFFGHTHVPVAFIRESMIKGGTYSKFRVEPGKKYFVNVGAVGQPRDGDPRAAYAVYDMEESTIELRRLEYDIPTAQKKILEAGLPPRLAERLRSGSDFQADDGDLKILILKPSSLGDVIHALPVLRLLKLHFPQAEISWWLDAGLVPLLERDPDLAGVIPFHRKRWAAPHRWPEIAESVRRMRHERFDWAIDLQGLARSGIFTWLAGAELTIGLDNEREGAREGAHALYDLRPPRAAAHTHAVDRYLAVLPLLGVPVHQNFDWLPRREEVARQVEEKWRTGGSRWIAVLPGGRWDNKRWPAQNYRDLILALSRKSDTRFAILGSQDEHSLAREIAEAAPDRCVNLAGQTTLWEMIEWIRLSDQVVTNDTGPMHVAAALRRPVVAIFGPTDPRSTGPYGQLDRVLQNNSLPCVPCMKQTCAYREPLACLHTVTPSAVEEKLAGLGRV